MIPLGLAATLLGDVGSAVGSAISSGLSKLNGQSSASEPSQPSFAAHLKAATSHSSLVSASNATEGILHHHTHSAGKASSTLADSSQTTSPTTAQTGSAIAAIGSIVNTKV
jgi:hypothetical protein